MSQSNQEYVIARLKTLPDVSLGSTNHCITLNLIATILGKRNLYSKVG